LRKQRWRTQMAGCAIFAVLLMQTSTGLRADEASDKSAARCAAIESSVERLQCFDDWARSRGYSAPGFSPTVTESAGKWRVSQKKNPMDDTEVVQLELESDSGHSRFGDPILLAIRCQKKDPYLAIWWHDFIGMERAQVTTRIGKEKALNSQWYVSNTHEATVLLQPSFKQFIQRMFGESELVAEVVPYSDPRITAAFDITGLRKALKSVNNVCNFSL